MKLVFFGTGNYSLLVLQALKKKFDITVFTTEKEKNDPIIKYCLENNISCFYNTSFNNKNVTDKIREINADLALVANFRLIFPKKILDLFSKGIINIHPSLLPKYRGATPGQSAIINNDKKTGVSIIKLDEKMDHGPILVQKEEKIKDNDNAETLYLRLFKIGANLISQTIKQYLKNDLKLIIQDDKKATYVKKLTRESGYINLNNPPSNLKIMIRAYFPWPGVWTKHNNKRIKLLPENMIQVEGKKAVNYKDFTNGYCEGKIILEKLGLL